MRSVLGKIAIPLVMVALLAVGAAATPRTAAAAAGGYLGGMNLANYCTAKYGGAAVRVAPFDAYSWRCRVWSVGLPPSFSFTDYLIWTDDVCAFQYGPGARSATRNPRSSWDWYCYR